MRAWLPVPGTTTGRLIAAALTQFGAHGFAGVNVADIAREAGVTTGALYHHFGSKTALWGIVRADVEQRVLDRIEGAAAVVPARSLAELAPAILVGFDYLVRTEYARLLAEPAHPDVAIDEPDDDRVANLIDNLLHDTGATVGPYAAAAWRAALLRSTRGSHESATARAGLERLLTGR